MSLRDKIDLLKNKNTFDNRKSVIYNKKLYNKVSTLMRTVMIGSISAMEKEFSVLWENDDEVKAIWDKVRNAILDLGNDKIRELDKEMKQYDIVPKDLKYLPQPDLKEGKENE